MTIRTMSQLLWSGISSEDADDLAMGGLTSSELANMFELSGSSSVVNERRQVCKDPMTVSYCIIIFSQALIGRFPKRALY